jgi:schlafen family protein
VAKQLSFDQVMAIIRSGKLDDLFGAVESDQLECKKQHYKLDDSPDKFELAKDVSSFANAKGGIILIGVEAREDQTIAADIIRKICAFPKSQAQIPRYRDILKDWIYPNLQKLQIDWFPSESNPDEGIVAIIIGNQDQLWRPFVITKTVNENGKHSTVLFGYAERSLDRSTPMGIQQLHLLLRDGLRAGLTVLPAPPDEAPGGSLPPPESPVPLPPKSPAPLRPASPGVPAELKEELIRAQLDKRVNSAIEAVELTTRPALILVSTPSQSTEVQGLFSSRDSDVVKLLEHPVELRRSGFSPAAGYNSRIVEGGEARRTLIEKYKLLQVWADGWSICIADGGSDFLCWGTKATNRLRINQLALIESTYLFVKFANDVLAKSKPMPENVSYWLMLRRLTTEQPAIMYPGPLTTFPHGEHEAQGADKDVKFSSVFDADPGLIAFKLVAGVYRWFGFDEVDIPYKEQTSPGQTILSPDQIVNLNRNPM